MPSKPRRSEIPKDCQHTHSHHEHGTRAAYISDLCGCRPCSRAHAAGARAERRLRAYGRWSPAVVSVVGSRRRIEALACNGWSMVVLARRLGVSERTLHMIFQYDGISAVKAAKIARLYDELWDQHPPRRTHGERISAARTEALAQRRGYVPPLAWDDEWIDDPDARPHTRPELVVLVDELAVEEALTGQRPVALTPAERHAAVQLGTQRGLSKEQIAERLRITPRAVERIRAKAAA